VFVHCRYGSDRTGTMIAIYRIAVQNWDREEAIREMVEGGYGFYPMWENLKIYLRRLDIDAIRRDAGLR
jgi:protein tyrosine/serine phosphatase